MAKPFSRRLVLLLGLWSAAAYGAEKPAWQIEWERTVQAAKQEGRVAIYAAIGPYHPAIFSEFQKDYPEVKVVMVHGSSSQISPRLLAERRAGQYLADVYMGGPTSLYRFHQSKHFDPITPLFMLPEVADQFKWWEGKHTYIDPERQYIFVNEGSISGLTIAYNTRLVKAEEFKSYWDILAPKWKGKIVSLDVREPGFGTSELRFVYYHPELGPEFIRRFFSEIGVVLARDHRQTINWVATEKFALCLFCRDTFASEARSQGLPIDSFNPKEMKEMPRLRGSASSLALMNHPAHPNAARLFINWFLSRRGQQVYQEGHGDRDSLREDVPKDKVPPRFRRVPGKKYLFVEEPAFMDAKPALKIVEEALSERKK